MERKVGKKIILPIIFAAVFAVGIIAGVLIAKNKPAEPAEAVTASDTTVPETSEISETSVSKTEEKTESTSKTTEKTEKEKATEKTTEKTVKKKAIDSWRTAYKNYLLQHRDELTSDPDISMDEVSNEYRYTFAYIDNDNIPEIIISLGSFHASAAKILTYYNGKVIDLGDYGSNGTVRYLERKGIITGYYMGSGCYDETVVKLSGGKVTDIWNASERPKSIDSMEAPIYYSDNKEVSKEEYDAKRASIYNENELKSNQTEDYEIIGLPLTKDNINKIETLIIK